MVIIPTFPGSEYVFAAKVVVAIVLACGLVVLVRKLKGQEVRKTPTETN